MPCGKAVHAHAVSYAAKVQLAIRHLIVYINLPHVLTGNVLYGDCRILRGYLQRVSIHARLGIERGIHSYQGRVAIRAFGHGLAAKLKQPNLRIGRQGGAPEETLRALRLPGKLAEAEMRRATVGVNTHKGAIFSMGILCGALGRLDRESWGNPDRILDECAAMAKGIVSEDYRDLTPETAKTAGQKLYLRYGITGVRGQAEAGFPAVREAGLPTLEAALAAGKNINEASCAALLALLVHTADTNMIHRGGFDGMQQATLEVREILDRENFPSRETLESLDKRFIEKNLSPGGSADLLALTLFLHFLRETAHMSEFCN